MRPLNAPPDVRGTVGRHGPSWAGHFHIARLDHWVKNLFVVPGIVTAISLGRVPLTPTILVQVVVGLLSVGLVASSNYVINELADAPFDRHHPLKRQRPVPSGQVSRPLA